MTKFWHTDTVGFGCTKCSPGCSNCWAAATTLRIAQSGNGPVAQAARRAINDDGTWTGEICPLEILQAPAPAKGAARVVAVGWMTDLGLWNQTDFNRVMNSLVPWISLRYWNGYRPHNYLLLSKRPDALAANVLEWASGCDQTTFSLLEATQALWAGTSCCLQGEAGKIQHIVRLPYWLRKFVMFEPLLEVVSLDSTGSLDWACIGQQTGPKAREVTSGVLKSMVKHCEDLHIPVTVKWSGDRVNPHQVAGSEYAMTPWGDIRTMRDGKISYE